jgi:hypothetical protein
MHETNDGLEPGSLSMGIPFSRSVSTLRFSVLGTIRKYVHTKQCDVRVIVCLPSTYVVLNTEHAVKEEKKRNKRQMNIYSY